METVKSHKFFKICLLFIKTIKKRKERLVGNSLTYRYILVRGLEEKCFLNMEVILLAELASNKGDANRHAHDKGRYNTTQRVNIQHVWVHTDT